MGRLFDVVASLANLRQVMRFEGQAAMELEFALDGIETDEHYELSLVQNAEQSGQASRLPGGRGGVSRQRETTSVPLGKTGAGETPALLSFVLDWSPMVGAILSDVQNGVAIGRMSAKFHNALTEAVVAVAKRTGERRVVLSGGCFQNRYLTERTVRRLWAEGFQPYWHQRVPPNDGGIALGQVVAALRDEQIVNRKS